LKSGEGTNFEMKARALDDRVGKPAVGASSKTGIARPGSQME
jgi:hypothetical protein